MRWRLREEEIVGEINIVLVMWERVRGGIGIF